MTTTCKFDVALRRHDKFGDSSRIREVEPEAHRILGAGNGHDLDTIRRAARVVVEACILDRAQCLNEAAQACGTAKPCQANKILRNRGLAHAQWPIPKCVNYDCNLNQEHVVVPPDPNKCCAASIPDEYLPVHLR